MCLHTWVCAGVCVGGEVVLCGGVGVVCVGVFVCRENGMHVCDVCVGDICAWEWCVYRENGMCVCVVLCLYVLYGVCECRCCVCM